MVLSVAVLAALALAGGGVWLLVARRDRTRAWLMLAAAAVTLFNLWSWSGLADRPAPGAKPARRLSQHHAVDPGASQRAGDLRVVGDGLQPADELAQRQAAVAAGLGGGCDAAQLRARQLVDHPVRDAARL